MSNSTEAVIAVLELKPRWAPELQRQFLQSSVEVRECRTVKDLLRELDGIPTGLRIVDLDPFVEELVNAFTTRKFSQLTQLPTIGIASPSLDHLEWILRDAGLSEFLPNTVTGDELNRICRRQLALKFPGRR